MAKADIYTTTGEKKGKLDLPKDIFGASVNQTLLARSVRVYLSNQRRAKAKVKNRGEVSGSRVKIWRQKGTGRARHGDRYAPIFVGGGVTHGPTGEENYKLKLTKKMRRQALFSALTTKFAKGEVLVVEDLKKASGKTKKMAEVLKAVVGESKKTLLVLPEMIESVMRGARNIAGVSLVQAKLLNPYQVLNGGKIVFMPESIKVLEKVFLGKPEKVKKESKKKGKKNGA